jgi:MFS superfamily sulfate permease-like transporter
VQAATSGARTTRSPTQVRVNNYIWGMKTSLSTLLTVAFIVLKLANYITWSWLWVLSPLWISAIIVVIFLSAVFLLEKKEKQQRIEELKKRFKL